MGAGRGQLGPRRSAVGVAVGVVVACLVLAACGNDAASPAPPPAAGEAAAVTTGVRGATPFVEPDCREPRSEAERAAPDLQRAADEIRRLGRSRFGDRYAGLVPCVPEERLTVYRLERGSGALDRAARRIARQRDVDVSFAAARFTRRQADAAREAVLAQFERLDSAGAPFAVLAVQENGTVQVGVRSDVPAAEQVLADLLERIYVILIPAP